MRCTLPHAGCIPSTLARVCTLPVQASRGVDCQGSEAWRTSSGVSAAPQQSVSAYSIQGLAPMGQAAFNVCRRAHLPPNPVWIHWGAAPLWLRQGMHTCMYGHCCHWQPNHTTAAPPHKCWHRVAMRRATIAAVPLPPEHPASGLRPSQLRQETTSTATGQHPLHFQTSLAPATNKRAGAAAGLCPCEAVLQPTATRTGHSDRPRRPGRLPGDGLHCT